MAVISFQELNMADQSIDYKMPPKTGVKNPPQEENLFIYLFSHLFNQITLKLFISISIYKSNNIFIYVYIYISVFLSINLFLYFKNTFFLFIHIYLVYLLISLSIYLFFDCLIINIIFL